MVIHNRPDGHEQIVTGDFNGDGRTDIANARSNWDWWQVLLSTGSGWEPADWSVPRRKAIHWRPDGHEQIVMVTATKRSS